MLDLRREFVEYRMDLSDLPDDDWLCIGTCVPLYILITIVVDVIIVIIIFVVI